ncbi:MULTISPECIES: extracellular solute-binding protein [unclassified Roseitalea]|uniref:ABC transporter substrate-binding protein n=1 Tax=unclassified Roseitalea TaxID=2639107 RepID=UPI00273F0E68|nr:MULTISPECIES: extracellular solute-binding protein [unclassified Roseitalea]
MSIVTRLAAGLLVSASAVTMAHADTIRFWTTEEQPERLEVQEQIAAAFNEATGHEVEVIPVTESELATRATAAFAAGDLPDVIYHTLPNVLPWAEAGILDVETNDEIIEDLGPDTFQQGAIDMADFDGLTAAVPVNGWTQMLLYRQDLFEQAGLEAPDSYADITAAIEELHNPPEIYGFVAATKVDEAFMSQVLEHVFLANGVSPVDEDGFAPLDEAATTQVLEFYKTLAEASPPGDLFWQQSRELYFAGDAAMIIWSPFILDELAGLRDSAPPTINDDPTSTELASKTAVVTTLSGPSNPDGAAWASINYIGVTADANTDVAAQFVSFLMDEGYLEFLSMAPEGLFPVRRGTPDDPDRFVEGWSGLPVGVDRKAPLAELYPEETVSSITVGLETAARWGVQENQLALASKMINSQVINRIVRQFIDGEIDASAAVSMMNEQLGAIE